MSFNAGEVFFICFCLNLVLLPLKLTGGKNLMQFKTGLF